MHFSIQHGIMERELHGIHIAECRFLQVNMSEHVHTLFALQFFIFTATHHNNFQYVLVCFDGVLCLFIYYITLLIFLGHMGCTTSCKYNINIIIL